MEKEAMSWTVTLIDAGDGSGDLLLPLPDDLVELLGWQVGDYVTAEVIDHTLVLKKHEDPSV
jgi:hypothetical protein